MVCNVTNWPFFLSPEIQEVLLGRGACRSPIHKMFGADFLILGGWKKPFACWMNPVDEYLPFVTAAWIGLACWNGIQPGRTQLGITWNSNERKHYENEATYQSKVYALHLPLVLFDLSVSHGQISCKLSKYVIIVYRQYNYLYNTGMFVLYFTSQFVWLWSWHFKTVWQTAS